MRPVRTGKSIADIDITKLAQGSGKIRIIGLLARMKAQIFQHQHITRAKTANRSLHASAGDIRLNGNLTAKLRCQCCGHRGD